MLLFGVVLVGILIWIAPSPNWKEEPPDFETPEQDDYPDVPQSGFTVMTWNIAFGGGLNSPINIHTKDDILTNLEKIIQGIKMIDPDILFLQEVDIGSYRSANINEYKYLKEKLGYKYGCFVTTWHCRYIPHPIWPPDKNLSNIHSGQAILSKFPITDCFQKRLPQPDSNSWFYNRFYIHRTIQFATLNTGSKIPLQVVNVHLEAFDKNNRIEQAKILKDSLQRLHGPLIVAGDFNAVPPDAPQLKGFKDEDIDFTNDNTIPIVLEVEGLSDPLVGTGIPHDKTFTYPANEPSRRLDYIFERGFMLTTSEDAYVPRLEGSAHLPVVANLLVR